MRIFIVLTVLFFSFAGFSQEKTVKTFTLSVKGNCGECKARIENAADIKGVKLCVWNEKTQTATITYRTDKTSPDQIERAILLSGHDVGTAKAETANYNKLPSCCKYRDKKCEDKK